MSPTVLRVRGYRLYFFSREEARVHVHVSCSDGEAKFWLTPEVSLAGCFGLTSKQVSEARKIVEERRDDIVRAWDEHFQR